MPYSSRSRTSSRNFTRQPRSFQGGRPTNKSKVKKEYIHPSKFIQVAKPVSINEYTSQHTFDDFKMHDLLKRNLAAKGFKQPSPIQDQTIPVGLDGRDVVGIANTGTGKTAAFAIPMLHRLMSDPQSRALIMAPTRELANQIQDECRSIGRGSGLSATLIIGGTAMGPQLRDLRGRPRVVIGTPGRIKDHLQQGTLDLSQFNIIVLDEFDRMLDMGFIHDIKEILSQAATERQSFFFSATLDARVRGLIADFSDNPVHITVKTGDTSDNVHQDIVTYTTKEDKIEKLHDLLNNEAVTKVLVFDDTKRSVEKLSQELESRGFGSDAIHGGKSQAQRQRALQKFKESRINVLVATDVAARGIDVVGVSHVINYSTPQSYADYTHRIGRAGRAGNTGYALTFIEKY